MVTALFFFGVVLPVAWGGPLGLMMWGLWSASCRRRRLAPDWLAWAVSLLPTLLGGWPLCGFGMVGGFGEMNVCCRAFSLLTSLWLAVPSCGREIFLDWLCSLGRTDLAGCYLSENSDAWSLLWHVLPCCGLGLEKMELWAFCFALVCP